MPAEIRVPELGESIYEVTVQRWLKREGESVAEGDPLVELETEKANVEIPADHAGVLTSISCREGETVQVGEVLGEIGEFTGDDALTKTEPAAGQPAPAAERGAGSGSATPAAEAPEAASTPTGDEGAETGHAPASPAVRRALAAEHEIELSTIRGTGPRGRVLREDVLALVNSGDRQIPGTESQTGMSAPLSATSPHGPDPQPESSAQLTGPSPAEQTEIPVPPAAVSPGQQIGTSASSAVPSPVARTDIPASPPGPSPVGQTFLSAGGTEPDGGRRERRERMTTRRRTIARRLVEAQQTAAMLTTFNEADMTAVMTLRKRRNEDFTKRHGARLGFMSFFAKAVVGSLKEFPYLNAEIQGEEIVLKEYYDIGIAVGLAEGLVVPVVRDADRKTFAQLEREIADLAARARENRLGLADLQGGTFTITNGGVYGSLMSTPILNAPQVGILGMHAIKERPVVVEGEIAIRPMMYLALSYDHRIVDGSDAVRFLVRITEMIEDPEMLLLEG